MPRLRSCSIWSTRITELRMIIPASAMIPRMAMKPIGVLVVSIAMATPMRPSGATLITIAICRKLPSWTMSAVSIRAIISGNWASKAALLCPLFSTVPPISIRVPAGIDLRSPSIAPATCSMNGGWLHPGHWLRLHGDGGEAAAPPDIALIKLVFEIGELAQRHRGAGRRRDLQIAQGFDTRPFAVVGARHDVDQIIESRTCVTTEPPDYAVERLRELFGA